MTLLIAGYQFEKAVRYSAWPKGLTAFPLLKTDPSGVFMVADSAITSGRETLLNGFRKIYPLSVKLWEPYFVGDYFHSYMTVQHEIEIFAGFAGSTLTAQHYLNGMTEHLTHLRISCKLVWSEAPQYVVLMDCERNILKDSNMTWDETVFAPSHIENLLTGERISEVVLHSLKNSLKSAKKHKISEDGLKSLLTPFVIGLQCPLSEEHQIYVYSMNLGKVDGVFQVEVVMSKLERDKVAVLGMAREFNDEAQSAYATATLAGVPPADPMFGFLCAAIDRVIARGDKDVSHPAIMKTLVNGKVQTTKRSK